MDGTNDSTLNFTCPVLYFLFRWDYGLQLIFQGVKIKMTTLIGMRLRRVAPSRIVNPMIKATKAGLVLEIDGLEAHLLAGGNVNTLVDALIAAQRANIPLDFESAAAIDLAGRVLEAVQVSVNLESY